jgi:hypothetical protein
MTFKKAYWYTARDVCRGAYFDTFSWRCLDIIFVNGRFFLDDILEEHLVLFELLVDGFN